MTYAASIVRIVLLAILFSGSRILPAGAQQTLSSVPQGPRLHWSTHSFPRKPDFFKHTASMPGSL